MVQKIFGKKIRKYIENCFFQVPVVIVVDYPMNDSIYG